jgi:hypothetical protein
MRIGDRVEEGILEPNTTVMKLGVAAKLIDIQILLPAAII